MKKIKQKSKRHFLLNAFPAIVLCWIGLTLTVSSQILDSQNQVEVTLEDGTKVILYGKANTRNNAFTGEYYYLPVNLHLSKRPDGTPEFLFLKYTTEERADAGGVQGALMHFLMEWGLTAGQENEAQTKLKEKLADLANNPGSPYRKVTSPKVMGAADVFVDSEKSFRIISATLTDEGMADVVASGMAPPLPGAKAAVAAKLDKNAAQLLAATFEKNRSITDVSIELGFKYNVLFPAVDGRIVIDWSQVQQTFEKLTAEYTRDRRDTKSGKDDRYTYDEVKTVYSSLIENKAVIIEIDKNTTDDATADKIVEGFMNVFIEALTDRDMEAPPSKPGEKEKEESPNIKHGTHYVYNKTKAEHRYARKREVYQLKYRVAVTKYVPVTGNLGSWYDGVRDNPACISSVNLNDPFFQHRDINLILDLEAEEMFGKEVNYVTVNIRKERDSGNDFQDQVTIDRNFLKEKGVKASLTYARGEDTNPDVYDYKVQWSLKGGNVFPKNPAWIQGDWEGVTLAPPVKPRRIEFEADLDELNNSDITRVTAELHYYKFGREVVTNIPITVSKGETLVEETIFTDRDTRGYAYRLIFSHKKEGKLAIEPEAKINDDYIYASIPEELQNADSEIFKTAKKVGKEITDTSKNKILDKFKNIIGGNNDE